MMMMVMVVIWLTFHLNEIELTNGREHTSVIEVQVKFRIQ